MEVKRVRPRPGSRRKQIEPTHRHGITLTDDTWRWLQAQAQRDNVSVSMLITQVIDLYRIK